MLSIAKITARQAHAAGRQDSHHFMTLYKAYLRGAAEAADAYQDSEHDHSMKMAVAAMHNDYDTFVALNGMECYECGSCTYACPAKRPLTQTFKQARQHVAAQRRKK